MTKLYAEWVATVMNTTAIERLLIYLNETMKNRYILVQGALSLMCVMPIAAQSEVSRDAAQRLAERWGGTWELTESPPMEILAPNGHIILDSPSADAGVIKRVTAGTKVRIAFTLHLPQEVYYITDWSWERYLNGHKPNWVWIPDARIPRGASNVSALLESIYDALRHDNQQGNCQAAYLYLRERLEDPEVVQFLAARCAADQDVQRKSATIALLADSPIFRHNREFCELLFAHFERYVAFKPDGVHYGSQFFWNSEQESERFIQLWFHTALDGLATSWIKFIVRNGGRYESVVTDRLQSNSMLLKWICVHTLALHNTLDRHRDEFDQRFYTAVFLSLRSDAEKFNCEYATRILVILRPDSDAWINGRLRQSRLDDQERLILGWVKSDLRRPEVRKEFELGYGGLASEFFYADSNDSFDYELPMFQNLAPWNW